MASKSMRLAHLDFSHSWYTDLQKKDMLYAIVIRSPIACGALKYLRLSKIPEGYKLITAKDIPGKNQIKTFTTNIPLLAYNEIRWKGEPIGILVGPDYRILLELYDTLDYRFTRKAPLLKSENSIKETKILAKRVLSFGDADTAWMKSPIKSEKNYTTTSTNDSSSEPDGAFCFVKGKNLTLYTPTLWVSHLKQSICKSLNIEEEHVLIRKTTTPKFQEINAWTNSVHANLCALASFLTKKPVKLSLSPLEQQGYCSRALNISIRHRMSATEDGTITSDSIRIMLDAGAYNPGIEAIVDKLASCAANSYYFKNLKIEVLALRSSSPPASVFVDTCEKHVLYAIECQMQEMARRTQLNPAEIRLKHTQTKDIPEDYPIQLNTINLNTTLEKILKESDFNRKSFSFSNNILNLSSSASVLPVRGIGLAFGFQGTCFAGRNAGPKKTSLEITMQKDSSVTIKAHRPSSKVTEIWKKIVSDILEVPTENISIEEDIEKTLAAQYPDSITSDITIMTQLVKRCCSGIQKQRFREPLPITVNRSLHIARPSKWDLKSFTGCPFYSFSSATAVAEVTIDTKTCIPQILSIWISADVGELLEDENVYSSMLAQTEKILAELNWCQEKPAIKILFSNEKGDPKQVGNIVRNTVPAAISNAIAHSLDNAITEFPFSPYTLFREIWQKENDK